jgi:flagellar hook-basal body complex protein FliE
MNSIASNTTAAGAALPAPPLAAGKQSGAAGSFKDFLIKSIKDVDSAQHEANHAVESLMTGGDTDPASVLTAVEKADLAFRMMLQMRNKVMAAYQEVKDIRI